MPERDVRGFGPEGQDNNERLHAIRATRVFDGHRMHTGHPLVYLQGSRIVGVDPTGAHPATDVPIVDLHDATLLPGLIDAHVHLAFDPEQRAKQTIATEDEAVIVARMRHHARRQLLAGVTTVRDLGDRDYLALAVREAAARGGEQLPEILAAGPPITRAGGHCWFLGGEADGVAAVRESVVERVARGVDIVKIMATGGAITPGWGPHESQYTLEELRSATEAAHGADTPITAHAHGTQGIARAVSAGVDGVEHCSFFTEHGVDAHWDTVNAMAEAGTFVGATEAWLPEGVMLAPHLAERLEQRSANFARMHREGVRVVCCSDAGAGPRKPHGVLAYGAVHFGATGWTNIEAIAAVTVLAAQACGLSKRKGRIETGFDADLIAVAGDPTEQLTNLLRIQAVWRAGCLVDRTAPATNS